MVAGAGIDQQLVGRNSEKVAGVKRGVLMAIRPGDETNPDPLDVPVFQPGEWLETASTGAPGELWWGRTATRHIFVGQESYVRLQKAIGLVPASLRAAQHDYMMRQMMAMVHKQPMTIKPGDERFMLFPRERVNYVQHAATMASFQVGFGGDGKVPPGPVSNARLELHTRPDVKGTSGVRPGGRWPDPALYTAGRGAVWRTPSARGPVRRRERTRMQPDLGLEQRDLGIGLHH